MNTYQHLGLSLLACVICTAIVFATCTYAQVLWIGILPAPVLLSMLAFSIQWLAFVPSYLMRTEKAFDAVGSLSFLILTAWAFILSQQSSLCLLVACLVGLWALRLGGFLLQRILTQGHDRRFDTLKQSASGFLLTWSLQGAWITITLLPVWQVLLSEQQSPVLGLYQLGATLLWLFGFSIETVADYQKFIFKQNPSNKGNFIKHGLWSLCQHPNYFGEITLWFAMTLLCLPSFAGLQWLSVISPCFVYYLLVHVSGIPLLRARAAQTWGKRQDYQVYTSTTPVLIPSMRLHIKARVT